MFDKFKALFTLSAPTIDKIEQMIREMKPVDEIAAFLIENFAAADVQRELARADGDLIKVLLARLQSWMEESDETRRPYLEKLLAAIDTKYAAAGFEFAD